MEKQTKKINYPRKIARILLKSILFLFLFIIFIFLLVLTPPVQRYMTGKVETYLQDKLKTKVEIGSVSFGLSGNIHLEDIYIEDLSKDTLLSGGSIKATLNILKLFSNEVNVKDIELKNITAKVTRTLPDTTFNFQFIVDAFVTEQTQNTDTAQTAPIKLNINDVAFTNVTLTYKDIVTGNDVFARIGNLSATIDTLDIPSQHYNIQSLIARNVRAVVNQIKPLSLPEPLEDDIAEALTPSPVRFSIGNIDLNKVNVQYDNAVSELHASVSIGQLKTEERLTDLQNNIIHLNELLLNNSNIAIRLGKKETVAVVTKEIEQELEAEKMAGWDIRVGNISFNNNKLQFDDQNEPEADYGMDYSHLLADDFNLTIEDFIFNTDSIGGKITNGSFSEKGGFELDQLEGDVLYASNQAYVKDLYIKTPGSEIQRNAMMHYASYDALAEDFSQTVMDIELVDSRVQVKDILAFAPQLRNNPALSNPEDTWYLNIVGEGTLDRINFESLQFDGLQNTQLNAEGSLTGLMNPEHAGGNFIIHRLQTNQTDIALFTGQRLSTPEINIPEEFDIKGTITGNAGQFRTNLDVNTSAGFVSVDGNFRNLTNPSTASYNAQVRTSRFQLGSVLRRPDQFGYVTGNFTFNGKGFTPNSINTRFTGRVSTFGYNAYQYKNINLKGTLKDNVLNVDADIDDPNAALDLVVNANLSSSPSFTVSGMIDSVKTMPLNFTPEPLVFRGFIDGSVSNISEENLDASILITKALFVAEGERLPLDTIQLTAGQSDSGNYIRLHSDVINANILGQYNLSELGSIIQNSIQPYFTVKSQKPADEIHPYDFTFNADIIYSPIMSAFVPGLTTMEDLHASGRFSSAGGMNAVINTPYILYNGNEISDLNIIANTSDSGLNVAGTIARIKSGNSFDIYNTRLNATALNNIIDFTLGIDDQNSINKYYLSGLVTQPSQGTYAIRLNQDSLLLNYEQWAVTPDNLITITPDAITANNFVLQKDNQRLSINSITSQGIQPLQVNFTDFEVSTITGFIKSDSVLINGVMNGNVTFRNLMDQPVFTSDLTVRDFSIKQDTIGNVDLQVNSGTGNRYITNATITGRGNDVVLNGSFSPAGDDINLDLEMDVRQLQLNTMEGALAGAINNASGAVNGKISIQGTVADPNIDGNLNFDQASFALTLLGSQFRIDNEQLSVTEAGFVFDSFEIRDTTNNILVIDGLVLTNNFINYSFDLDVNATNFELLNTTKAKGKIYYGKLNITSDIHIAGTESSPIVDGSVTVNDGTDLSIVIPQAEPGVVEREGIVQFVDFDSPENDTLFSAYDSLNFADVIGMDIVANIEIKKEAIFNIIIDQANGDFLNVRGEAVLSAGVDPSGKITLVGNYTLEEGSYQISFNFLQRKFDIVKGSTITWTGAPTTAILNVDAVYIANTAPIDLVEDQIAASTPAIRNTYLQDLPFEVHLSLTGELLKPVIDFNILLPPDKNYGVSNDIITVVQTRLDQMRLDEGEINKQVFSLLLLGRFVGENPFASSGDSFSAGAYARQSVSKLLTEQLNNLAAGLFDGVGLNFDVVSTEDYTTGERRNRTDLNVGLSKRLLNDRLQVTVGSNFLLEGPQTSTQRNNNLAGNIAVDYQLSKDGKYLIRFYRTNEYEGLVDGYIIETGLSFILSVDYNRFREIFTKRRQKVTSTGTITTPKQ